MDIVVATDKGFVMPTGVMMYSVCVNNPRTSIVFHVITDESVSEQEKKDLDGTVMSAGGGKTVKFYAANSELYRRFPCPTESFTHTAYVRLFLTEILPKTLKKVLYLDGDIIVRRSLATLWETDIENYAIAAVPDSQEANIEFYNRLRFSPDLGYFNSGVMLVNLEYWRIHKVLNDFMNFLADQEENVKWADQDVLNVVFKDKKRMMPIKYNLQYCFLLRKKNFYYWKYEEELKEAYCNPVIVHYTGPKPWKPHTPMHPLASTFFKYQDQTRWRGWQTPDRWNAARKLRRLLGNILRAMRLLPPLVQAKDIYIDVAPID